MSNRTFKIPFVVGAPLLAASLVTPGTAEAGRNDSACDKIKPEQRLSEERQMELQSAIDGAITGLGRASADVDSASDSKVSIQVLSEDALAKSWFIYQTCVMKEAGVLDDATAQSLVSNLMGIQPTQITMTVDDTNNNNSSSSSSSNNSDANSSENTASGGSKTWLWVALGAVVVAGAVGFAAWWFSGDDGGVGGDDTGWYDDSTDYSDWSESTYY